MKIALQLSGRLRFTENSLASLLQSIINPLQPDVYCSFWQPENTSAIDRYFSAVNPKAWEFEQQDLVKPYLDALFPFNVYPNMPSMSYKFYRVSQVRKTHASSIAMNYDVVIQARTDNWFMEILDLPRCQMAIDQHAILCANQGYYAPIDDYVARPRMVDNFYLGPTNLVDQANMTFWDLRTHAIALTQAGLQYHVSVPEIIQSKVWQAKNIPIGGLPGWGKVGNFWYEIDKTDTPWR